MSSITEALAGFGGDSYVPEAVRARPAAKHTNERKRRSNDDCLPGTSTFRRELTDNGFSANEIRAIAKEARRNGISPAQLERVSYSRDDDTGERVIKFTKDIPDRPCDQEEVVGFSVKANKQIRGRFAEAEHGDWENDDKPQRAEGHVKAGGSSRSRSGPPRQSKQIKGSHCGSGGGSDSNNGGGGNTGGGCGPSE